jgi:hypothetical protein
MRIQDSLRTLFAVLPPVIAAMLPLITTQYTQIAKTYQGNFTH